MSVGLEDVYLELARDVYPEILKETGTELVNIIRPTRATDGYGGESSAETTLFTDVPVKRKPHTNGNPRYQNGGQWTSDIFTLPVYWLGAAIGLKVTDKLFRQEGTDAAVTPARMFSIVEIRNFIKFYEVVCSRDENQTT